MSNNHMQWETVCDATDVQPYIGVRALVAGQQLALFRIEDSLYAISAVDPFSKAAVLARGLVGDIGGELMVASPVYKQHFSLHTGVCLEDAQVAVATYPVRERDGKIEVCPIAYSEDVLEQASA